MLPDALLLDESELCLHPIAVALVGALIVHLAKECQVIVATQFPLLSDEFNLTEIVVLNLQDGLTRVRRFNKPGDQKCYADWVEHYSTGELW